ncbi:hypothetical protein Bdt_1848 [Bdellovibrio bacteriovorus str. Tiberius]|uniref:Uncharacterized protein n=2 Tax=Bdellovibrio bacteriovorus TaxID=959 RepID=K7ZFI6_BDEBC|nr:hypothetical protein Bdt_1848 [Bdellovibrio bacteriovorus str. Tiberius]
MEGTYRMLSCENLGAKPHESLCEYSQVSVHPMSDATAIYFSRWEGEQEHVRSFGLPVSTRHHPQSRYCEKGDVYAAYERVSQGQGEVMIMKRTTDDLYHLSIHLRADNYGTLDVIEMDLERLTTMSRPAPDTAPGPTTESF